MDLEEYLEKNMIVKRKFAQNAGVGEVTLYRILAKQIYPSAKTAQKIVKLTNGEVTFEDLFKERE